MLGWEGMAKEYRGAKTQDFIPIKEIRDGIAVLRDGSLRAILLTSSVNMALKSQEEQEALISQFQSFLNSLEFPIQIAVQSRRFDVRPYLLTLERRLQQQKEELLRVQTREYIEFIKWFTSSVNIMDKKFFVVIPYKGTLLTTKKGGGLSGLFGGGSKKKKFHEEVQRFEEQRSQLEQRIAIVQGGLQQMGIRSEPLNTEQAIEVFYTMFNPGENHRNVPDLTKTQ